MNTKGNQRAIQTENKIKWVFLNLLGEKKEISRISVSEICSRANIHRTTFYVHYKDVSDLMEHLVAEMYMQIMNLFVEEGKGMRSHGFRKLFVLVGQHKSFFNVYLEATGGMILTYDKLPKELQENIDKIVPAMGFASEEELLYHQTFFCEGLSAVIRRWVRGGCKESPEEMERIIEAEYHPNRDLLFPQGN
nr:TetR/AcrR family transcriptional regulator [uncultured Acetatifactor sp.]